MRNPQKNRKGQITIFIIIGIVLLFSTGVVLFVQQQLTKRAEFVQPELVPLKMYVEQCIKDSADEAIFLAEAQGGYVIIPQTIDQNPSAYLDEPIKIPYWLQNNIAKIPEPGDIEGAIAQHIDQNLINCVGNFAEFKEFNVSIVSPPASTVTMGDKVVDISTSFELDVLKKSDNSISKIKEFSTFRDSALGKLYELAARIMIIEQNTAFVENAVMELIAASSLPNEGGEMTCEKKQWSIQDDIIPEVQALLIANFQYLLFDKTYRDRAEPYSGAEAEWNGYFNKGKTGFLIGVGSSKFNDVEVRAVYNPNWEFVLDVKPKKGDTVKPVEFKIPLVSSCFKMYNHKYTIQFPLKFSLVDKSAGKGETFSFATPIIIKESQPARGGFFQPQVPDTRYKQDNFCSQQQKTVIVRAMDSWSHEPLMNASITMQCVKFACDIGQTGIERTELGFPVSVTDFLLKAKVPECSGAVFVARKEGYLEGYVKDQDLGTYELNGQQVNNDNVHVDIPVTRLIKYNPVFTVIQVSSSGGLVPRSLRVDEKVILSMIARDYKFDNSFIYPTINITNPTPFQLLVGDVTYDVDIKIIRGNSLVGGYIGNFTTDGRYVESSSRVRFNILVTDNPSDKTGIFNMLSNSSLSKKYQPEII